MRHLHLTQGRVQQLMQIAHRSGFVIPIRSRMPRKKPLCTKSEWKVENAGTRREWQRPDLHVVLVHPQIPQNAGNIARSCAATNVALHLVKPLGFEIDDRKLKRAGLDYWDQVTVAIHESWDDFVKFYDDLAGPKKMTGFSKLGKLHYATEGLYPKDHSNWLLFGAETTGLPPAAHEHESLSLVKIPMTNFEHVRSLNLSTSAGVGIFEALRQLDGAVLPEDVEEQPIVT